MSVSGYPVRVDAIRQPHLSRGLWLVKWVLVIPHYIVLFFLWTCFAVLSVVAFFAILFTGHYPRAIFDFNVGVLRWSWRVSYYAYGALGTDRYPPFTLDDVPDYPAHLEVSYPEHLSRGLVLVKWWLLAIPHYLVVSLFVGGGLWTVERASGENGSLISGGTGLIGLLVLMAAIVLLFTGSYPASMFDLVLGMNRWVLRVAAYAALMTDTYPPFRLDQGPDDPATVSLSRSSPAMALGGPRHAKPPSTQGELTAPRTSEEPQPGGARVAAAVTGWLSVAAAALLLSTSVSLAVGGWAQRDAGFLMSPTQTVQSASYALTTDPVKMHLGGLGQFTRSTLLGDIRMKVTPVDRRPLFIGIAPASDAGAFLAGVDHTTIVDFDGRDPVYRESSGGPAGTLPAERDIWVVSSQGVGTQTLTWTPRTGDWVVVVMDGAGQPGIRAKASVGAQLPAFGYLLGALFVVGCAMLLVGIVLLRAPRHTRTGEQR